MKKITLLIVVMFASTVLFSQSTFKWNGNQTDQIWDYGTANWLDPAFPIPLPKTFIEGSTALFDDTSVEGSDTLKINGVITVNNINVNATKTYVLRSTSLTTDSIIGNGTLIKEGAGIFIMDVKNRLLHGTTIKNGKLMMEGAGSPNIFGDTLRFEGGSANLGTTGSTSSKKVTFKPTIVVPQNATANIELARYSYLGSKVIGGGSINLLSAGERTFLGYESLPAGITQLQPDWSQFTGTLKVSKLVTSVNPGFWGLLLNTSKTFKDSLETGFNVDSTLYNKKVTIGSGAVLGTHSGVKAYAIGELNAEDNTSVLAGYRSASNSPRSYFFVGGLNTDVIFPGRICQAPGITSHYTHVAFYKVGTGTYTFTHPNNDIIGGLQVRQGKVLINDAVLKGNYYGGVGSFVTVTKNGTIGGTGRISGNVDVFGILQPGSNGVGTLTLSDSISASSPSKYNLPLGYSISYKNASGAAATFSYKRGGTGLTNLNLHAGSVSEFEINSSTVYDKVVATGRLKFGPDTVGLGKPKIKIIVPNGATINDGDRFEIIKTKYLDAASADYNIEFPTLNGITWSVETKSDTVAIDKEIFTFVDHLVTKTNADSIVTTVIKMDSVMISYKFIVVAHGKTGINNLSKGTLTVYPNPVNDVMELNSTDKEISSVQIINLQGQIVVNKAINKLNYSMTLSDLPTGIYFAKVRCGNELITQKIVRK